MTFEPATERWRALGSTVVLRVARPADREAAAAVARVELERVDRACSRFRDDSELSRANARAGAAAPASELLLDAVALALRAAELTDGLLDPCLGGALERAGYDRDWELIRVEGSLPPGAASATPRVIARSRGGAWRQLELDRAAGTVRVPAGAKLDLGATAKALAADLACAAALRRVGGGVLVALGGDIAALGAAPAGGWDVHVTDDHRAGPDAPGERVTFDCGGLATSSVATRRWRFDGAEMHHIIDPVTGVPARTRWRTATVAAGDCADANVASTAALLLRDAAPGWLQARGLPARLVEHDGTVHAVGGWPAGAGEVAA